MPGPDSLPRGRIIVGQVRYWLPTGRIDIIVISNGGAGGRMGRILVRGIPDADMDALSRRAERLGRSREQEVRLLIARAAEEERRWAEHARRSETWRERLSDRGLPDTKALVREDRERG